MRQRVLIAILFFSAFAFTGFGDVVVFAQGSGDAINLPNPLAPCGNIPCLGEKIARGLLALVTPIVVIMVLVGAFQILTAGGSPERVSKGRNTIFYAVIGYAIVLVAEGLTFIIREILGG